MVGTHSRIKNKRKGAYGNRREHYDENYDSRYNGQIQHFLQRSQPYYGDGGVYQGSFACVEILAGPVGPVISPKCTAGIRHRRIDQLWAVLNGDKCADVKSLMKELHLFMDEDYVDDIPSHSC